MVALSVLLDYLNELLQPNKFVDYCPNGLQIQGKAYIKKIVTGVSANQALIAAACKSDADAILVHHGFFWKNESPCITGMKYHRIKTLFQSELNLLAYHLPLDAHPVYGNNVQLAGVLDIQMTDTLEIQPGIFMGKGKFLNAMTGHELAQLISDKLQRPPLYIPANGAKISTVGWCTGAAQDFITTAIEHNLDAYITGEISERIVAIAEENNIHFYAAGHHATERYGVKALGEHLSDKFDLDHEFIDISNPV